MGNVSFGIIPHKKGLHIYFSTCAFSALALLFAPTALLYDAKFAYFSQHNSVPKAIDTDLKNQLLYMHLRCIKCQQKCNYIIYMTIIPEWKPWAGPTSIKCSTSLLWQVKNLNISQRTPTLWAFHGCHLMLHPTLQVMEEKMLGNKPVKHKVWSKQIEFYKVAIYMYLGFCTKGNSWPLSEQSIARLRSLQNWERTWTQRETGNLHGS